MNTFPHTSKDTSTYVNKVGIYLEDSKLQIHETRVHHTATPSSVSSSAGPSHSFLPSFLDNIIQLRKYSLTMKRLPQAVRIPIALELSSIATERASYSSLESWSDLLNFPHVVLNSVGHKRSLTSSLTSRLRENQSLWQSLASAMVVPAFRPQLPLRKSLAFSNPEGRLARQVESKVAEGDARGAVRLLDSSESV